MHYKNYFYLVVTLSSVLSKIVSVATTFTAKVPVGQDIYTTSQRKYTLHYNNVLVVLLKQNNFITGPRVSKFHTVVKCRDLVFLFVQRYHTFMHFAFKKKYIQEHYIRSRSGSGKQTQHQRAARIERASKSEEQ